MRNMPARPLAICFRSLCRRMRRDGNKGSAAIEFAFVAPVFFLFMMGIIEVGVMFFANSVLQKATDDAARLVRTGQVQGSAMTQAQFRTFVCSEITPILQCSGALQIDMRSYSSFGGATYTSPYGADGNLNPNLNGYQPGVAGDVVLVRAFYQWTLLTPMLGPLLQNQVNGKHLITATAAFQNEPF
jgi:Flp pilus assembly protein TadG